MQNFTPAQLAALRQKFLEQVEGSVPLDFLDLGGFTTSNLFSVLALYFLQAGQAASFATAAQGILATTALQPGSNVTNNIAGVPAATLVSDTASALSLAATAYGWGNHALAGYLTSAPKLKLYQPVAAGATPETFTLPETPSAGSSIIVFVAASPKHYVASDPPASTQFYWDGATTVKADTVAADEVSIYYEA